MDGVASCRLWELNNIHLAPRACLPLSRYLLGRGNRMEDASTADHVLDAQRRYCILNVNVELNRTDRLYWRNCFRAERASISTTRHQYMFQDAWFNVLLCDGQILYVLDFTSLR